MRIEPIVPLKVCSGHTAKVNAIGFLPDGTRAISGSNDNTLRLWNLGDAQEIHRFNGHHNWIMGLAVSAAGASSCPPAPTRPSAPGT